MKFTHPPSPTLSDRSHHLHSKVDLTIHITDITNLLTYEDLADVSLVGDSYGGMVITGVATIAPEWAGHADDGAVRWIGNYYVC